MRLKRVPFMLVTVLALACLPGCLHARQPARTAYGVFLGVDFEDANKMTGYETIVIDAAYYTKAQITTLRENGAKTVWSYLNIGSVETFRDGYETFQNNTLAPYKNWPDEYWMDVSLPAWQSFLADSALALAGKGVDGFFLDNADVYDVFPTDRIFNGLIDIINDIGIYGLDVVINGGDVFVQKAVLSPDKPLVQISAVNQECVFTHIDFSNSRLILQTKENTLYYCEHLEKCAEKGLSVYLTEYAESNVVEKRIQTYCSAHGFHYYISSSIELDG
jgi:hypothetical protein